VLETWYLHAYPGRENPLGEMDAKSDAVTRKVVAKAAQQTNTALLQKVADKQKDGRMAVSRGSADSDARGCKGPGRQ